MADDKSKMSVADILAAARKADAKGGAPSKPAASEAASASDEPAADAPAAPAASAAQKPSAGGKPSVADILAMARGGGAGAAPAAKESPKPAPKPAAAKAAPKKEAAAAAPAEPADTQSILAAARKATKPGPMTKAEAAAKGVSTPAKKPAVKETIVVPPMPVKPDYAKPAAERTSEVAERRAFLFGLSALAVGFTAMTASLTLWTLGSVRFMFPNVLRLPPSRFKVGFPDAFAPGQVEEKFKAQFGVWIVNAEFNGEQQLVALKSVCTHLGCTPNWLEAEQKFKCPCHGSGFYKDGINFEGPAPRPLERYAISIGNDGQVEVDKSRTFQEEMGQWSDPSSFIPA